MIPAHELTVGGMRADDPYIIFGSLASSWGLFVYLCKIHTGSRTRAVVAGLAITVVYGALVGRMIYHKSAMELEDAHEKLSAAANMPSTGITLDTTFTITNGSSEDIGKHQIYCTPLRVVSDKFVVIESLPPSKSLPRGRAYVTHPDDFPIRAGGQAETDQCFAGVILNDVYCADVLVGIDYVLLQHPDKPQNREFRFVINKKKGGYWYKESPDDPESYCVTP